MADAPLFENLQGDGRIWCHDGEGWYVAPAPAVPDPKRESDRVNLLVHHGGIMYAVMWGEKEQALRLWSSPDGKEWTEEITWPEIRKEDA